MDDKTFVATYVAQEAQRINDRLQQILGTEQNPTEHEKDEVLADIEKTLARLQSAVSHLSTFASSCDDERFLEMVEDD